MSLTTVQNGMLTSDPSNASNLNSGTVPKARMPSGAVLQVVMGTILSGPVTSSTSFVSTGLSATITPTSSSSKILIFANGNGDTQAAQRQISTTIYRNSTNLSTNGFANAYSPSAREIVSMGMNYLDSPATTSATAYTVYFASTNAAGDVIYNVGNGQGSQLAVITLMEIKQ